MEPGVKKIGDTYYALVNYCQPFNRFYTVEKKRNTLALTSSTNAVEWTVEKILLFHPLFDVVGYQYPSWIVDPANPQNILAAIRTAHTGNSTTALNQHDSNLITFHRFVGVLP